MNFTKNMIDKHIYKLFSAFIIVIIISSVPFFDRFSSTLKICRYIFYFMFAIAFIINIKRITWVDVLLIIISVFPTIFSNNRTIIILALIIITLKNYDINRLLKVSFLTALVLFFLVIILALTRLIPDWIYVRNNTIRHSLGFLYPTDCHSLFLAIVLLYFAAYRTKYKIMNIIVFGILNFLMYKLTDARLSFILISISLSLFAVLKIQKVNKVVLRMLKTNFAKILSSTLPFVLCFIFILLVVAYNNNVKVAYTANEILSDRIKYTSQAFESFELTPFGQPIKWNGYGGLGHDPTISIENFKYNFVDSSYPKIIFDYGCIPSIFFLGGYSFLLVYFIKKREYILFWVVILMLQWFFVEPWIINIDRNFLLILFSLLLAELKVYVFNQKGKINEKVLN